MLLNREIETDRSEYLPLISPVTSVGKTEFGFTYPSQGAASLRYTLTSKLQQLACEYPRLAAFFPASVLPESTLLMHLDNLVRYLEQTGIVKKVEAYSRCFNDTPRVFTANVMHQYASGVTDGFQKPVSFGNGTSVDQERAIVLALGEFLERYFLSLYINDALTTASVSELQSQHKAFLDIATLAKVAVGQVTQVGRVPYHEHAPLRWQTARAYSSGRSLLVPAQLAHWTYQPMKGEPFLREQTTNGAAGMSSYAAAVLGGLHELIQRDAFMIYWLNAMVPTKIDPESVIDPGFAAMYTEAKRFGFTVHCLNLTTDLLVPTIAVVLEDTKDVYPKYSMGLSTKSAPTAALCRAFEEALGVYVWLRQAKVDRAFDYTAPPFTDRTVEQRKRTALFADQSNFAHYKFFLNGVTRPLSEFAWTAFSVDVATALAEVVVPMEALGPDYTLYVYEAKHPILKKVGYHAVQTIVPALVPIHLTETYPCLDARRLKEVPKKLGFPAATTWNPVPQPFP